MADKIGLRPHCAEVRPGVAVDVVRSRTECLIQLLSAFHDIADFDDIHQAAERLETVQAWIRREARAAAADAIFDDEASYDLRIPLARA